MTQQLINVGTNPNDGTGDPIRAAFQKVNTNFSELYGEFGQVNFQSPINWSGVTSPANCPIYTSYDVSGSPTAGQGVNLNYIGINSDHVQADTHTVNALVVNHNFGGAGATGQFNGLYVVANQTGPTANTDGNYISGLFVAQGTSNDGGSGSGALSKGELYGFNSNTRLISGATNWKVINAGEFDIAVASGASVDHKRGIAIVQTTSDVSQGLIDDTALTITNQAAAGSGTPGWNVGISFGTNDGYMPIAPTGTLIGSTRHSGGGSMGTAANGVDLSDFTFTGSAFKSKNFSIDGSGNATLPCTILAPVASSLGSAVVANQSVSGTPGVSDTGYPNYWANAFFINSDNAAISGSNFGSGLTVFHNYGGTGMTGGRVSLAIYSNLTASPDPTTTNRNYVAGLFDSHATVNAGGTDTNVNAKGALFGCNPQAILKNGATNWLEVTSGEHNFAAEAGSSCKYKFGLTVVALSTDAVAGSVAEASLQISAQTGAVGIGNGILFGNYNGQFAVSAAGTLINSTAASVTNGIDFSNVTFAGSAFKSNGFSVSQSGVVFAGGQYQIAGAGIINFQTRSLVTSPVDGTVQFSNNAQNGFTSLRLGPSSSASYVELRAFGAVAGFRLANDAIPTFSQLPSAASCEGAMSPVSDSTTNVWGATITGGGANHVLAYSNGTNWTVAAK